MPGGQCRVRLRVLNSEMALSVILFRTVLKSGSRLSVVALRATAFERSARSVPLAEGVQ